MRGFWICEVIAGVALVACGTDDPQQPPGGECSTDADCDDGTCDGGTCTPSLCGNGELDGAETDVDCGGDECRQCAGGRTCATAGDCISGNCVEATGKCFSLALSFADPVMYESGFKPYAVTARDLDADGDIDLAVANEIESTIAVFRNDGDGVFARMASSFPTGEYPTGTTTGDFNRDGVVDVITADYHGNSVTILLGAGAGDTYTLTAGTSYPTADGAETSNLAVGDVDGDLITDVVAANPQAHSVSVLIGRADGTLAPAIDLMVGPPGDSEPYSVAIGDFDDDGNNDLAIADNRTGTLYLERGNGDGTFVPDPAQPGIGGDGSFNLLTEDMDLDGALDLVVANRSSSDVSVLRGRGDGSFRDAIVTSTGPMTGPYSIAIADFNLDGVPDVITSNFMSGTGTVLLGTGDGRFEAPIVGGTTGEFSYGVAAGDFNGDGKPDFAIANAVTDDLAVVMSTAN